MCTTTFSHQSNDYKPFDPEKISINTQSGQIVIDGISIQIDNENDKRAFFIKTVQNQERIYWGSLTLSNCNEDTQIIKLDSNRSSFGFTLAGGGIGISDLRTDRAGDINIHIYDLKATPLQIFMLGKRLLLTIDSGSNKSTHVSNIDIRL